MTTYFYTYNIIFDAPVSGSAKLVYAYLCKCADADGKSYPSHKAIGAGAGIGVTTVKKALAELENAGLISIQGQARPDRGRRANIYTVIKEETGFFLSYANVFTPALTAKARLVFLYLYRLASGRGQAYPSHRTTAKACGLSVAGVRLAVDELEAAGFIERQAQYRDNGGQRANLYTIINEPETVDSGSGDTESTDARESERPMDSDTADDDTERNNNIDGEPTAEANTDEATINEIDAVNISGEFPAKSSDTAPIGFNAPRRPGLFVLSFIIFSIICCFMPTGAASLFTLTLPAWCWLITRVLTRIPEISRYYPCFPLNTVKANAVYLPSHIELSYPGSLL